MKPLLHKCTRCGQPEHEPLAACDGKSRHQRRVQTALAPKCACGNTATSGDSMCGRCRAVADAHHEERQAQGQTQEFFDRYGEHVVQLRYYENHESFTVEELFQHFAVRMRGQR